MSPVSCLLHPVSSLLSHISCLLSPISRSSVSSLPVSRLPVFISCLLSPSPVSLLLSLVSRLLSFVSVLLSAADLIDKDLADLEGAVVCPELEGAAFYLKPEMHDGTESGQKLPVESNVVDLSAVQFLGEES